MPDDIALRLEEHETKLSELYALYADLFPDYREFWEELSRAEENHALIIQEIMKKVDGETIFLNKDRFRERPLQISLDYIQEMHDKALQGKSTLINALSTANTMESAIIDGKFFEVFQGNSPWLKKYVRTLQEETREHQQMIKQMLLKVRKE